MPRPTKMTIEAIALEVARETSTGLKLVLDKIESLSMAVAKLEIESKNATDEIKGGDGQESLVTRIKVCETLIDNLSYVIKDEINKLSQCIKNEIEKRENLESESRSHNRQSWIAIIGAVAAIGSTVLAFLLGK